jgi:FkbM family methyltransferase
MIQALTRLPPRSLLGALVRLPLRLIPKGTVVVVRGGLNKGAAWIVGSSVHGCWLGTYESEKQAAVSRLVRPGMVVWDVGANAGFYTLAFSRLVGPTGRVYAFEPLAENAHSLLRHVRLNELANVSIVQAALSDDAGLVGFRTAPSNAMGRIAPAERSYLVPALTADGFLALHPDARPDLIKIDIEGSEGAFLAGARELLQSAAPRILLALHGADQSRSCSETLRGLGYSLRHLDGTTPIEGPPGCDEIMASRGAPQQRVPADGGRVACSDRG